MTSAKAVKTRGFLAAGGVAILQGTEGIIFTLFGLVLAVSALLDTAHFSIVVALVRETVVLLVLMIIFWPRVRKIWRTIRSRGTLFFLASGFFTSIGNTFYILGISFAGPAYGVVLTALYPVFSMLLFKAFFKDRQNAKVWIGVALSLLSGLLFVLLPNIINQKAGELNGQRILGMIFGMLSAFFWAIEAIVMKRGFDAKKLEQPNIAQSLVSTEATMVRTFGAWGFTLVVLFPLSFSFGASGAALKDLLTSWQAMLIVISIAALVIVLRFLHIFAIRTIGPKLTAIVDNNNFLVPPFLAIFLAMANWTLAHDSSAALFEPFDWWVWLLTIPLFVGVFIVLYFEKVKPANAKFVLDRLHDDFEAT